MLSNVLDTPKSALSRRLARLGRALEARPPRKHKSNQLVFLCGAAGSVDGVSPRRAALKSFLDNADTRIVYAEAVFREISRFGRTSKNLLDLEHQISDIADRIIIILESESAFCELGAFAHPALREKLIIINDSRFKGAGSFINGGPLSAVEKAKSPVLWYPMGDDGRTSLDGIGAIFAPLLQALTPKHMPGTTVDAHIRPLRANKDCLYFVHDLVLMTGPATYKEIVDVLIAALGRNSYDELQGLLAVLRSAGLTKTKKIDDQYVHWAADNVTYLDYAGLDPFEVVAAFRGHHLKNNPQRFVNVS